MRAKLSSETVTLKKNFISNSNTFLKFRYKKRRAAKSWLISDTFRSLDSRSDPLYKKWFKIWIFSEKLFQKMFHSKKSLPQNQVFLGSTKLPAVTLLRCILTQKTVFFESKFSNNFQSPKNNFTSESNAWWEIRLENWRVVNVRCKVWHAVDFSILSLMIFKRNDKLWFFFQVQVQSMFFTSFSSQNLTFQDSAKKLTLTLQLRKPTQKIIFRKTIIPQNLIFKKKRFYFKIDCVFKFSIQNLPRCKNFDSKYDGGKNNDAKSERCKNLKVISNEF